MFYEPPNMIYITTVHCRGNYKGRQSWNRRPAIAVSFHKLDGVSGSSLPGSKFRKSLDKLAFEVSDRQRLLFPVVDTNAGILLLSLSGADPRPTCTFSLPK